MDKVVVKLIENCEGGGVGLNTMQDLINGFGVSMFAFYSLLILTVK